ncbi:MAG TPA: ABC transporter ATP-binding protein [Thermoplasmata archaeon]|jgi:ABC-2 type transport system ATP-binding protein|nr:ABC transporter ATP-binding protein [Thermoplasmata archaeon]
MSPSLEAVGLTKRFGSFTALDHLNLRVEGAKCVGFLGPNGAGKTTTLKMFTDLIFPTEGEARINGISVQQDRKRALSVCGDLVESPEIYPSLTPREAFEMIGALRGMHSKDVRSRTAEVLAEVKMSEWADQKVGSFSKGMKQRVNIAASLLSDPEVAILDEPSTGLDPRGMAEVREIVRGLKRANRLIFMSSHILSEVVDVCDEVALINHGKLLFYDTLANVTTRLNRTSSMVELSFVGPVSDATLAGTVASVGGVASVQRVDAQRARIVISGGPETQSRVLESLATAHVGLLSFEPSQSALEELYLQEIARGD